MFIDRDFLPLISPTQAFYCILHSFPTMKVSFKLPSWMYSPPQLLNCDKWKAWQHGPLPPCKAPLTGRGEARASMAPPGSPDGLPDGLMREVKMNEKEMVAELCHSEPVAFLDILWKLGSWSLAGMRDRRCLFDCGSWGTCSGASVSVSDTSEDHPPEAAVLDVEVGGSGRSSSASSSRSKTMNRIKKLSAHLRRVTGFNFPESSFKLDSLFTVLLFWAWDIISWN